MYLWKILGTYTKVSILSTLLNDPERAYIEKELAAQSGTPVSEVNRQMPDLVTSGLVHLERIGKAKVYTFNKKHFMASSLKRLFRNLNDVYLEAAKKICHFAVSRSKAVKSVILFGSVAKQKVRNDLVETPSDIDLIFVVKDDKNKGQFFSELISYINATISEEYGIVCYPIVLSENEYQKALKNRDEFILAIQSMGVELYGTKPKRFG